jgi:oligosaccharyltransferase complex subunit beta
VLEGESTAYSAAPSKSVGDSPENASEPPLLVAAVQARNNARVVISGSLALFSNSFYRPVGGLATGNDLFCGELSKWVFGEAGVLRFRDIVHHKQDGSPPDVILHEKDRPDLPLSLYPDPEITRNSLVYRIKDSIVYSMVVEQYSVQKGEWEPFSASDMQMEFVMLDPYVRKTMVADPASGRHVAEFIAPDSYGVFKFRVLYRREGYSVLHAETQVSIRPFKHNEYERFIYSAYPYYASALSATATFLVFSVLFIFMADSK